jgi:hypothetical protein
VNTCFGGFLNAVLNQGFVYYRQDFLGHRLGGRKKAGAVAGDGKQAFSDHIVRPLMVGFTPCGPLNASA